MTKTELREEMCRLAEKAAAAHARGRTFRGEKRRSKAVIIIRRGSTVVYDSSVKTPSTSPQ